MTKRLVLFYVALTTTICVNFALGHSTVNYEESNVIIANPERGLQKYSITNNSYNTQSNYSNLSQSTLTGWRSGTDKVTVLFRYFLLDAFLQTDISQTYLTNIQKDFDIIRNSGFKCLVRFSYSDSQSGSPQQPTKTQIIRHIEQLAPLLSKNKDVIVAHQAGFIGTWGEWYYTNSSELGDQGSINTTQWNNRKAIVDAMLAATPIEIPLQVRYPQAKKTMYGTSWLNESTAYQNTPNARIGFFNDAFLNNWGDMGTYNVNSKNQNPIGTADYNYLANETKYTPMSGETNGLNGTRTDGSNALHEMNLTNWTCINRDYHGDVWSNWISAGIYENILKKTGYRFVLKNSDFRIENNNLKIKINLENKGYARLFKERKVYLVLQNTADNQTHSFLLDTDPRTWEGSVSIEENIDVKSLPIGTYNSYLHMPDINASIAERAEYAIQFANKNVWNAENGYNNLSQSFTIIQTANLDLTEQDSSTTLNIFPNPFSTQASVYINKTLQDAKFTIASMNGQIFSEISGISGEVFLINRNGLPSGMYLVQLLDNDNTIFSKRILIY